MFTSLDKDAEIAENLSGFQYRLGVASNVDELLDSIAGLKIQKLTVGLIIVGLLQTILAADL